MWPTVALSLTNNSRIAVMTNYLLKRRLLAVSALFVNTCSVGAFSFSPSARLNHNVPSLRKTARWVEPAHRAFSATSLSSSFSTEAPSGGSAPPFRRYDKIQVEVVRFGRLGASVEVIGLGHKEENCIGEDEPALGLGLILQREIQYFRSARGGLDVIVGEVLPAYVERVREDGRLDISIRDPGGKGKADTIGTAIMQKLKESESGTLDVGDKSTPDEINAVFPGTSKAAFKKAVAALFKKGLVKPGKHSVTLMSKE